VNHVADLVRASVTFDFNVSGYKIGDFVRVVHDDVGGYWQIVKISEDLDNGGSKMELVAFEQRGGTGYWLADPGQALPDFLGGGTVPETWSASSDDNKARLSYWYPADGLDPDDNDGKEWSN
jgi:hypothetical protein